MSVYVELSSIAVCDCHYDLPMDIQGLARLRDEEYVSYCPRQTRPETGNVTWCVLCVYVVTPKGISVAARSSTLQGVVVVVFIIYPHSYLHTCKLAWTSGPTMSSPSLGTSPPVIPVHRQPSPLSFSVSSHSHAHSPPPSPDGRSNRRSLVASSRSSVALALPPGVEIISQDGHTAGRSKPYVAKSGEDLVPVQPAQDSILFRSTVAHRASSGGTHKKLSKAVHQAASVATEE